MYISIYYIPVRASTDKVIKCFLPGNHYFNFFWHTHTHTHTQASQTILEYTCKLNQFICNSLARTLSLICPFSARLPARSHTAHKNMQQFIFKNPSDDFESSLCPNPTPFPPCAFDWKCVLLMYIPSICTLSSMVYRASGKSKIKSNQFSQMLLGSHCQPSPPRSLGRLPFQAKATAAASASATAHPLTLTSSFPLLQSPSLSLLLCGLSPFSCQLWLIEFKFLWHISAVLLNKCKTLTVCL